MTRDTQTDDSRTSRPDPPPAPPQPEPIVTLGDEIAHARANDLPVSGTR